MYFIFVALFLFVLPAISVLAEALLSYGSIDLMLLIGKWFVFWGVGVRLFIAGVRQVAQPQFTAESIFQSQRSRCAGDCSRGRLRQPFDGGAGVTYTSEAGFPRSGHHCRRSLFRLGRCGARRAPRQNASEWTAFVTDLFMFLLLATFLGARGF